MIKLITGDIFEQNIDVLLHGANCCNAMYSGIAGQIRKLLPEAIIADEATKSGDRKKLGTYSFARITKPNYSPCKIKYVVNGYCQFEPRTDIRACNYEATYRVLEAVRNSFGVKFNGCKTLGIPYKFQCGLAGGNWNIVNTMIQEVFENSGIRVLICAREQDLS